MPHPLCVLALPGCSAAPLFGIIELMHTCNRIAKTIGDGGGELFSITVASLDGLPVRCASGQPIGVDAGVADIQSPELLFIPAAPIADRAELAHCMDMWREAAQWLAANAHRFALVSTSCSGSFLLAEAGLLDGQRAATAWWLARPFRERYPQVSLDAEAICVLSGRYLCGGSTTSYQDVALCMVEKYAGKHVARLVAKYMMVDNQRRSQAPYSILSMIDNTDPVVARAETWIRRNLHRDFRIEDVAAEVAVSPRTLIRRFQHNIGESPQGFTQRVRIEKSKILLETTRLPLKEIIQRCGYSDESAFRRLFRKYCEVSPREYRRRFNTAAAA